MKILAETKGDFMLSGGEPGDQVEAFHPCVVSMHSFWEMTRNRGQLTILAELSNDATQAAWLEALKEMSEGAESDADKAEAKKAAVDAFAAEFPYKGEPVAEEAPPAE